VVDPVLDRGIAAQPVRLRPAGDARADVVLHHVFRDLVLELLHEIRPLGTRADNAHIALQHIEKLRQFVDARPAQEGAELRAAGIVLHRPLRIRRLLIRHMHGPELVHDEGAPIQPHPLLLEDDGTRRRQLDPDGGNQHDRRRHDDGRDREHNIENPLQQPVAELVERNVAHVDERDAGEIVEVRPRRQQIEIVGDNQRLRAGVVAGLDDFRVLLVCRERQRNDDFIDQVIAKHFIKAIQPAENRRHPMAGGRMFLQVVVEKTEDLVAQLGILQQTLIEIAPDRSRAENEQILLVVTQAAQPEQHHLDREPVDRQERQVQPKENAEKFPRYVNLLGEVERA